MPGKALRTPTPTSASSAASAVTAPPEVGGNSDQIARMKADEAAHKLSGAGASRTPDEIRESGVLDAFAALEGVEVPKSEKDRTVADDSVIVRQGLSKLSPEEIEDLKEKAYKHPEVEQDLPEAIKMKHYGSEKHRKYGELIEELTGGVISAEEAMAMNPTGGLPGPGAKEIPLIGHIEPVARHAMRHDATGFLLTRFGVGPGYGSKTSAVGRESDDPLAGQILGVFREMFTPSDLPKGDAATKGERFA